MSRTSHAVYHAASRSNTFNLGLLFFRLCYCAMASDTPAPGSPSEEELLKWWGPAAAEAAANASAEMMQKAADDALDEIRGFAPISPTEPFPVCKNDALFGGGSVENPP